MNARQLYAELGATPVINAHGNMTMLGGSTPSPAVQEAMQAAGRYYVDMDEFLASSGEIVADLLDCQAALVTSGCSAALLLGTAACMTGSDPEKMARLPDTTGMKTEIVIQRGQRYKYERVVRMAGTRIVAAGSDAGTSPEQLAAAIGPGTLALLYPAHDERPGLVPLREAIDIAHDRSVPILVDAASRVYPVDGLKKYAAWGADLVGYGAKYFGGLNSTGLLCGRKDLVEAARLHSFASFEKNELPGFGRPLKVDRQEVVAVVHALREWLSMDHDARFAVAGERGRNLRRSIRDLPYITIDPSEEETPASYLSLTLDEAASGQTMAEVEQALRAGDPSIWVQPGGNSIHLCMFTVVDGDEQIIAARLREIFGEK